MDFEIKRKNGFLTIVAYLLIFYVFAAVLMTIMETISVSSGTGFSSSLFNLIIYVILFIAVVFINKKELLIDIKAFLKSKDLALKIIGALGIFYIINIFFNTLISNIEYYANIMNRILDKPSSITSTAENQSAIISMLEGDGMILMIIAACIIGPICEEIVFRKAFFNVCKTKEMGILVSSLCFCLIHITTSIGMGYDALSIYLMSIPYLVSGVAFGLIYIKNDCNIVMPTIVHMLSNIISIIGIMFLV